MLLLLYVQNERSYDRHHENSDRIYRYVTTWAAVSPLFGPTLREDYPELIEKTTRFYALRRLEAVKYGDDTYYEGGIVFADSTILDVFTYPFISGNPETALDKPFTVIITESIAKKYFRDSNPLGETVSFARGDYEITGVIEDLPSSTHLHFDIAASFSSLRERLGDRLKTWNWGGIYTYVLLNQDIEIDRLESEMPGFGEKYFEEALEGSDNFQALTDIHLYSHLEKEVEANGNVFYVYLLSIIAGFVLIIACINFTNLTTARASDRAREVGIRKTFGAEKNQLIRQFLGESLAYSLLGLGVGILLVEAILPLFNIVAGRELSVNYVSNFQAVLAFFGIALFVGVLAGSYPAFILSRYRPSDALKALNVAGSSSSWLRGALVIFQFSISIFLFIGATVVYQQLSFLQTKELGFNKDQVLVARTDNFSVLRDKLLQLTSVSDVSAAMSSPGERIPYLGIRPETMPVDSMWGIRSHLVDVEYVNTMQMEVTEGRAFSREMTNDVNDAFMLNESAAEVFKEEYGWDDVVGQRLVLHYPGGEQAGQIIGVVQDFNFESLHADVDPLIMYPGPDHSRAFVRLTGSDLTADINAVREVWQSVSPGLPFEFTFVDVDLNRQYESEQQLSRVFSGFTIMAMVIACLGLFGLAAYMAEKRKREIGIRKAVGASVQNIVYLFSKEIAALVTIAILIAVPASYIAVRYWLDKFAYHVDVSLWTFIAAGFASLIIALVTISYQTVRAAHTNPVDALRVE